jgi:beta-glucuronidase
VRPSRLLILACLAAVAGPGGLPAGALAQGGAGGPPSGIPAPQQPPPAPDLKVEAPGGKPLIRAGQVSRRLLGGTWYFRLDDAFVGDAERWYEQEDLAGWTAITVPHNWNAGDTTLNKSSVGWYRKEFTLPQAPRKERRLRFWRVRFEGSNYRTKVFLNGRAIGGQTGLFPFEAPLEGLRRGRNTLVVKVSSLRSNTDLTHWRPAAFNGYGTGGWWNFGGLLREVYVREIDTVDIADVHVLPRLRKLGGPAKVEVRTLLRNPTGKDRDVSLVLDTEEGVKRLDPQTVPARGSRKLSARFTIERPRLWQPGRPSLYDLNVGADLGRERKSTYRVSFGVKKLVVGRGGILKLNGRRLNLRGASIHEDDLEEGGALSQGTRNLLVSRLKDLGATVTRSHYPLHPAFIEAFDRAGIMYWVQVPVYQIPNSLFARIHPAALRAALLTVRNNLNHASIFTWSLANEPAESERELGLIGPGLERYIADAARAVRELDDTRLVGLDRHSRVGEPVTSPAYEHLDVLGVNEYFGWYNAVRADIVRGPSTLEDLGPFLDGVHAANPDLPLVVTEFGAEGSRPGPVEQRGSYEFQRKWVLDHLAVHASKPYVAGSIHWALRDFRVHPQWQGGAPADWATPPWHNKSPIEEHNGRKPLYFALRALFRRTKPLR